MLAMSLNKAEEISPVKRRVFHNLPAHEPEVKKIVLLYCTSLEIFVGHTTDFIDLSQLLDKV